MKKEQTVSILSSLLILLFAYAAFSKIQAYKTFKFQLVRSPFITHYASTIAWLLPSGEILVCLALAFHVTRLIGLYASLALMSMFTAYIFAMTHFSYYVPCSCGGVLSKMSWTTHFYFNIIFVIISIIGIFLYEPKKVESNVYVSRPAYG